MLRVSLSVDDKSVVASDDKQDHAVAGDENDAQVEENPIGYDEPSEQKDRADENQSNRGLKAASSNQMGKEAKEDHQAQQVFETHYDYMDLNSMHIDIPEGKLRLDNSHVYDGSDSEVHNKKSGILLSKEDEEKWKKKIAEMRLKESLEKEKKKEKLSKKENAPAKDVVDKEREERKKRIERAKDDAHLNEFYANLDEKHEHDYGFVWIITVQAGSLIQYTA